MCPSPVEDVFSAGVVFGAQWTGGKQLIGGRFNDCVAQQAAGFGNSSAAGFKCEQISMAHERSGAVAFVQSSVPLRCRYLFHARACAEKYITPVLQGRTPR